MDILKIIVILITGGATLLGAELSEHTRSERWMVKTLSDSFVLSTPAIATTIELQAELPVPEVGESVQRLPSERTLYSLAARLVEVREEFDGDYHLVLEDPDTHLRMVAEIPDGSGPVSAIYRNDFIAARQAIDQMVGHPGLTGIHPPVPPMIEITGVGFFDEQHMFTPVGMAPNGREIHPVLSVKPIFRSAMNH